MGARATRTDSIVPTLVATLLVCLVVEAGPAYAAPAGRRTAARRTPEPKDDSSRFGRVTYISAERAYLNRGMTHGLKVGQTLRLLQGRGRTTCRIDAVSEKAATCVGPRVQKGARFQTAAPAPAKPPPLLPPLPSTKEQERQLALVQGVEIPLVGYDAKPGLGRLTLQGQLFARHETWASVKTGGGPFHGEELHGSIGFPILPGLHFNGDFSVWAWPNKPPESKMIHRTMNMFVR